MAEPFAAPGIGDVYVDPALSPQEQQAVTQRLRADPRLDRRPGGANYGAPEQPMPFAGGPATPQQPVPPPPAAPGGATDEFQYVKLPDGQYGKFKKSATDADIRKTIEKDFPDAFKVTAPAKPGVLENVMSVLRTGTNVAGQGKPNSPVAISGLENSPAGGAVASLTKLASDPRKALSELAPVAVSALASRFGGNVLSSPVVSSAIGSAAQYALDPSDMLGPAANFVVGALPATAVRAWKATRAAPPEAIKAAEDSIVAAAQRGTGEFLPGQSRGLAMPARGANAATPATGPVPPTPTTAFGFREEAANILGGIQAREATLGLRGRINARQELEAIDRYTFDRGQRSNIPESLVTMPATPNNAVVYRTDTSVKELDEVRRNLLARARDMASSSEPNSPAVADLTRLAKRVEDKIAVQYPDYKRYLDAYHRQESVGRLQNAVHSNDPVGEFDKQIGKGMVKRPDGSYVKDTSDLTGSAFNPTDRAEIRDLLQNMKISQERLQSIQQPQNKTMTTIGTIVGAGTGAPLGKAWLGGHIGRDVSQLMAGWLSNADTRRLLNLGVQRGLMDNSGFWMAMSLAGRGALDSASGIVDKLPGNPAIAVPASEPSKKQ